MNDRIKRVFSVLRTKRLQGAYIKNKSTIKYLCGFDGSNGVLFVASAKAYLLTDARYTMEAKKIVPYGVKVLDIGKNLQNENRWKSLLSKHNVKRLGFEANDITHGGFLRLKKISKPAELADFRDLILETRMQKDGEELQNIKKAQNITDEIFKILRKKIKCGMTENHVAWMVVSLAHELGAAAVSFAPIVGFGIHSAAPHHKNSNRKLVKGDLILLDMGVIYKGYCSDMTRMLFTKKPTSKQEKVYNTVLEAQEKAAAHIRAGVMGMKVDAVARAVIDKAGFVGKFGHSLGHGVGLDIHELPNLSPNYKGVIPESTVVTVEPGIYLDGEFGVRLEDMVVVKKTGTVNITKSSKKITDCTIKA